MHKAAPLCFVLWEPTTGQQLSWSRRWDCSGLSDPAIRHHQEPLYSEKAGAYVSRIQPYRLQGPGTDHSPKELWISGGTAKGKVATLIGISVLFTYSYRGLRACKGCTCSKTSSHRISPLN